MVQPASCGACPTAHPPLLACEGGSERSVLLGPSGKGWLPGAVAEGCSLPGPAESGRGAGVGEGQSAPLFHDPTQQDARGQGRE